MSGRLRKFLLGNMVTAVGRSVLDRRGACTVTRGARYTDDLVVPGAWYGNTLPFYPSKRGRANGGDAEHTVELLNR